MPTKYNISVTEATMNIFEPDDVKSYASLVLDNEHCLRQVNDCIRAMC
jgi:hypothetical protein